MRLTILHTNDIHGRQERIAQIATRVKREKRDAGHKVLYLDAGDVEDSTNRLSNVTRGAAMHRLLGRAGCDAATVGNAAWLRYGAAALTEHARVSPHPQLVGNFQPVSGPVPSILLGEVGVFGLTAPMRGAFEEIDFGFRRLDELEVAKRLARDLRQAGARLVILLSHLGLDVPEARWDDRRIAAELQDEVDLVIGGHTHEVLPEGVRIGRILVAQAGCFGDHLGRVEVEGTTCAAAVDAVGHDVDHDAEVEAEARRAEAEVDDLLAEAVGTAREPIDAQRVAEILRIRMSADVGLFVEGLNTRVLDPGPITRGDLWEASPSANNPGVATLSGVQLLELLERARGSAFASDTPRVLRGRSRGRLAVAGIDPTRIEGGRQYRVASTDLVLDPYGGYARGEWSLSVRYDFPTTVREAIEEYLRRA